MTLKRKRSDSEISSTGSSILSTPPSAKSMDMSFSSPFISQSSRDIVLSHLSSRTRKRFRDNRPSEAMIHQHTLSVLFSAQKSHQIAPSLPQTSTAQPVPIRETQQTSLHSFWALPNRASSCVLSNASPSSSPAAVVCQATNCDDCDALLVSADGDAMDVDMDIDMYGSSMDYGCSRCDKQICHRCAISNLGVERQCLMCAGKRTWVGGIGWMDQD